MCFAMPRTMFTSSCPSPAREQPPHARHQLLRIGRIEKLERDERFFEMRVHALDFLARCMPCRFDEAQFWHRLLEREAQFVREHLHRLREIQRTVCVGGIGAEYA